jgi:AcrR family transcriptional regulator
MRNLASRLGLVPMALYRHVASKEDLLDGMVETVYGELDVPTGADRRATMRQRATSMREALQRHPWVVELMETSPPGPANLHYHNAGIACLREQAGLPIRTAIDAYDLVDSYVYDFALQEKTLPGDIAAVAESRRHDLAIQPPGRDGIRRWALMAAVRTDGCDYCHRTSATVAPRSRTLR